MMCIRILWTFCLLLLVVGVWATGEGGGEQRPTEKGGGGGGGEGTAADVSAEVVLERVLRSYGSHVDPVWLAQMVARATGSTDTTATTSAAAPSEASGASTSASATERAAAAVRAPAQGGAEGEGQQPGGNERGGRSVAASSRRSASRWDVGPISVMRPSERSTSDADAGSVSVPGAGSGGGSASVAADGTKEADPVGGTPKEVLARGDAATGSSVNDRRLQELSTAAQEQEAALEAKRQKRLRKLQRREARQAAAAAATEGNSASACDVVCEGAAAVDGGRSTIASVGGPKEERVQEKRMQVERAPSQSVANLTSDAATEGRSATGEPMATSRRAVLKDAATVDASAASGGTPDRRSETGRAAASDAKASSDSIERTASDVGPASVSHRASGSRVGSASVVAAQAEEAGPAGKATVTASVGADAANERSVEDRRRQEPLAAGPEPDAALLVKRPHRLFKLQRRVDRQTAAALDESSERASGSAAIGGTSTAATKDDSKEALVREERSVPTSIALSVSASGSATGERSAPNRASTVGGRSAADGAAASDTKAASDEKSASASAVAARTKETGSTGAVTAKVPASATAATGTGARTTASEFEAARRWARLGFALADQLAQRAEAIRIREAQTIWVADREAHTSAGPTSEQVATWLHRMPEELRFPPELLDALLMEAVDGGAYVDLSDDWNLSSGCDEAEEPVPGGSKAKVVSGGELRASEATSRRSRMNLQRSQRPTVAEESEEDPEVAERAAAVERPALRRVPKQWEVAAESWHLARRNFAQGIRDHNRDGYPCPCGECRRRRGGRFWSVDFRGYTRHYGTHVFGFRFHCPSSRCRSARLTRLQLIEHMRRSHALQTQGKDAAWLDKHMGCFQSTVHRGPTSEDPFFRPNEAALIDEPLPPRSWAAYRAARLRRFRALRGSDGDEGREQGSGDGSGEREGANGGGVERPEGEKVDEASTAEEQGPSVAAEAASATAAAAAAGVLLLGGVGSKEAKKTAMKRGSDEASEGDEASAGKKRKASDDSGSSDSDSDSESDGEH